MKTITILSGRAMIVELPEGAQECNDIFSNKLWCFTNSNPDCRLETMGTDLPEGNWQIVGRLSEVSHCDLCYSPFLSDIKPIYKGLRFHIETVFSDGHRNDFKDGIQALDSAIRAEGWMFENPLGQNDDTGHNARDREWRENQPRVLDRSRCLLLRRVDG